MKTPGIITLAVLLLALLAALQAAEAGFGFGAEANATGQPAASTRTTTHGARMRPTLPPPAIMALASGPA